MNIQIFGKSRCFDTRKAERYFKERRVKFQSIDLPRFGMARRELLSVLAAVGSVEALLDEKHPDAPLVRQLSRDADRVEKLLEDPTLIRTPVVRCGKRATVGCRPDVWRAWEDEEAR